MQSSQVGRDPIGETSFESAVGPTGPTGAVSASLRGLRPSSPHRAVFMDEDELFTDPDLEGPWFRHSER